MNKHTPGKMPAPREPNGRGNGWKVGPAWLGENAYSEETAANARRIVACWNACEGFSTKALETQSVLLITPSTMVDAPSEAAELRAQRDELLQALQTAKQALAAAKQAMPMNWEASALCEQAEDIADAAIAKATGEQA